MPATIDDPGDPRRDRQRAEGKGRELVTASPLAPHVLPWPGMRCRERPRSIRAMAPDEIAIAADWAAAEGWNPGLADAACFATVDAGGFLIGELDGAPAATISCVNYDDRFAFLGFYIVRPDLRGRGYGLRIWNAAVDHAGGRTIGLDGVVAQQENYKKSGFRLAYRMSATAAAFLPAPRRPASSRSRTCLSRAWRRTMPRFSPRRVRRSCARGSTRPAMSAARWCATASSPPGA